jgi:predicted flap endonuclease-1-like 5' DNA nuclease
MLSRRDNLPQETADAIMALGLSSNDTQVHVIGGTAAISNQVTSVLGGSVERLSGPTRFETSQAVVEAALERFDATPRPLLVATGSNFPDALAAGALAAKIGGPLLLVPTGDLPDNLATFIRTNRSRFSKAFVIGGTAAVSGQVRTQVERVLNGLSKNPPEPDPEPDPEPEPGCVDINSAGFEDLQQIIHIGPDRAQQIIDLRPWASVDDLTRVSGIGPARLQDIKNQGLACVT